ncbi:MAG: GNAT family N-acetyltransferase, partial [Cellulomonadaceae bacterium]
MRDLPRLAAELSDWQSDRAVPQLHPGDLGWHSLVGPARTAADLRVWARDGETVALAMLDGPDLVRMAIDPSAHDDDELARQIGSDVSDPDAGVLAAGEAAIEARGARSLRGFLAHAGWTAAEPWTPFRRDLSRPIDRGPADRADIRVEAAGPDRAEAWVAVHWSAFKGTPFRDVDRRRVLGRWRTMADGPFAHLARHLIAVDRDDRAVAVTTVWSAGPGRPGLIEPMGVH